MTKRYGTKRKPRVVNIGELDETVQGGDWASCPRSATQPNCQCSQSAWHRSASGRAYVEANSLAVLEHENDAAAFERLLDVAQRPIVRNSVA
ncbi:hypothetical protein ACXIUS_25095 [Bosea thiooxidans]